MKLRIVSVTKTKNYRINGITYSVTANHYQIEKKFLWFWIRAGEECEYGSNDIFATYADAEKAIANFMPAKTTNVVVWESY